MGGISTWRDAAEFLLLGASTLQVCTAVMHYGFRIVEDLCDGLSNWMDEKGFTRVSDVVGRSLHRVSDFNHLDLRFVLSHESTSRNASAAIFATSPVTTPPPMHRPYRQGRPRSPASVL